MTLALFDFDGTLTTKDTLGEFLKFSTSKKDYFFGMCKFMPYFIAYKLKLMKNYISKEKLFKIFFNSYDEIEFKKLSSNYSLQEIDKVLREDIYIKFKNHITNGDRVIVVSASMKCWLEPWCQKQKVELLSTELEFKNGIFSGKFLTKNCYGEEKLNRVKEILSLDDYETIYAYGDSAGDDAILSIAHYKTKL